ncbi:MAG: hypothetical protein LKG21_06735 [Ruminococcus sp.]|jgi:hypothetical protein|nr:hypothetical protein [Ruminococcus sp.]
MNKIDDAFVSYAADTLADTSKGLTGSQIVKYSNSYAVDFNVNIPVTSPDFGKFGSIIPNKRTALYKNLCAFDGRQQFVFIKELCELPMFEYNNKVNELKSRLFERYSRYASSPIYIEKYEPTGWERVDRALEEMKLRLETADNEEKYQAIGMIGRETLITIAQQVFVSDKHPTADGVEASTTDAKRMLEAYLRYELSDSSEKAKKMARSAVDLGNQLTHDRNATKRDATI